MIYVVAIMIGAYLALLSDRIFYYHIKFLSLLFRTFDKRRGVDCMTNLNFAFGDSMDRQRKEQIVKRCYDNFAFVLLNASRLMFANKQKYISRFDCENWHLLSELSKNGNAIFITAHYGDWEATSRYVAAKVDCTLSVVGRLTQFNSVNTLMEISRRKFGANFLDKKGVTKSLIRLLNKPNNMIGLVIDQNMSPSEGLWVKMFGKDVTHSPIASILSRKYNLPIIGVYITLSEDYSRYKIHFDLVSNAIITNDSKQDIENLTQLQASYVEGIVRAKPDEWFWFHKRFKAKYAEIYQK